MTVLRWIQKNSWLTIFLAAMGILSGEIRILEDDDTNKKGKTQEEADSSETEPEENVLEAATDEIYHCISSLFGLQLLFIQNLSSRDRLETMENFGASTADIP